MDILAIVFVDSLKGGPLCCNNKYTSAVAERPRDAFPLSS